MASPSRSRKIAPSILAADFAHLADEVAKVTPECDLLHVDVMDGHFVPNISIGPAVVTSLRPVTDLYLDCHLMIENPGDFLDQFAKAGADSCTVHVELGDPARRGGAVPGGDRHPPVHERAPRLRRPGVPARGARQAARRARDRRRA